MVTPRKTGFIETADGLVPTDHLAEQLEELELTPADLEALLMGLAWASGYEVEPDLDALVAVLYPKGQRAGWVQWLDTGDMGLVVLLARVSCHRAGGEWGAGEGGDQALLRVMWTGDFRERTGPRAQGSTMRVRVSERAAAGQA